MAKISINIATGTLQKDDLIVGIDLGTTNSLIAIIHPDTKQPTALKDIDQTTLVPSIIHFGQDESITVGQAAKPYLESDGEHTIYSVKRLLGKSFNDIQDRKNNFSYKIVDDETDRLVKIKVGQRFYSPIELSSYILKELKNRAEHILKMSISKCVITVPAYFNDAQRQATRDAGRLAGLDVLRIINEPTAASLAYGFGKNQAETKNIAVYDLGGGTFDISILKLTDGVFDVLSTHGDTYLGGDDFDLKIMHHFATQMTANDELAVNKILAQSIRLKAEEAKRALSSANEYHSSCDGKEISISKKQFEELIEPLVDKTIHSCEQALKDSHLNKADIDVIVMVGGSTRTPYIKKRVSQFFEKEVFDDVNPDEVVALGAAIQADILAGNNKDILLLDITPLSLGIETMGGLMDVLIPRNSKIPSKAGRQYSTQKDGQSGIAISVYQGERDLVSDNRKLASFNLTGIPAMPAGLPKVDIQFLINADGILQVNAKELRSGVEQKIEVKPQYGLNDEDVEAMLLASITHAKEDIQVRALVEAKTEAQQMIQLTENFMFKHQQFIEEPELFATRKAMNELLTAIDKDEKDQIILLSEKLNEITAPYAERVMDIAVAEALKGKQV